MNKVDAQEEIVVNKKTNKDPRMEFVHRRDCRKEQGKNIDNLIIVEKVADKIDLLAKKDTSQLVEKVGTSGTKQMEPIVQIVIRE